MTEITLKLDDPAGAVELLMRAAKYAGSDGWNTQASSYAHWLARQIEAQVKPAVEEPQEFGSIVRARQGDRDAGLWTYTPWHGEHYWRTSDGWTAEFDELAGVEVLRVGIGEPSDEEQAAAAFDTTVALSEAYSRGYEDGVQSNLPSPVDRSNINSALREEITKIGLRGDSIGTGHSYELADAVMKVMANEPPQPSRFCTLRQDCRMADGHDGGCRP